MRTAATIPKITKAMPGLRYRNASESNESPYTVSSLSQPEARTTAYLRSRDSYRHSADSTLGHPRVRECPLTVLLCVGWASSASSVGSQRPSRTRVTPSHVLGNMVELLGDRHD